MGSLMAGWDAPLKDPNSVKLMRNKSLTKEEIEAYWRLKKKTEEDHLNAISASPDCTQGTVFEEVVRKGYKRSSSLPAEYAKHDQLVEVFDSELDNLIQTHCWWTRSNSAFLNEPPVMATEVSNKYASQHHVATMASTNPNTRVKI